MSDKIQLQVCKWSITLWIHLSPTRYTDVETENSKATCSTNNKNPESDIPFQTKDQKSKAAKQIERF